MIIKNKFSKVNCLLIVLLLLTFNGIAQESIMDSTSTKKVGLTRKWRIETEPTSFFLHGYNLHISRNITKNNQLNLGLYVLALDVPEFSQKGIFVNLSDSATARLGFELALIIRYKIKLSKGETNPYVGLITGWEYFDIKQPNLTDLRISTYVFTPYLGYEIYLIKERLFINPQIRTVFYFGTESDDASRIESLNSYYILPAISIGVRL